MHGPLFVHFLHSSLHYVKKGNGSKALLIFHGFGQDHHAFDHLPASLQHTHTLYIFDLYFHGASHWQLEENPLKKDIWKEIVSQFLIDNCIKNFSVLGFSMGGKFALACVELFPKHIEAVILLAPDGIKTSAWYSLATYPTVLRRLFKSMIIHHQRFLMVARAALRLRLIDKGVFRFVESQMNTEEKRKRVYYSWVVFRHLKFDLDHIAGILNAKPTLLTLIIGKYDRIITTENMRPFINQLKEVRFEVVEAGHTDLIREACKLL